MTVVEPTIRRWTRDEYYRLAEEGWFRDQRVQLIQGEIVQMAPQGHAHAKALQRIADALRNIFGSGHWVRVQMPLNVSGHSAPEPDIAVTEQKIDVYQDHPVSAILVVEVADSSIRLDRQKAALYAAAGIAEYWIVNLNARRLEVYRQPTAIAASESGFGYFERLELQESESVASLARPNEWIAIVELFN